MDIVFLVVVDCSYVGCCCFVVLVVLYVVLYCFFGVCFE